MRPLKFQEFERFRALLFFRKVEYLYIGSITSSLGKLTECWEFIVQCHLNKINPTEKKVLIRKKKNVSYLAGCFFQFCSVNVFGFEYIGNVREIFFKHGIFEQ